MNSCAFQLNGTHLYALPSGALWWPDEELLCVSDLHFGKSERMARRGGTALPPYETRDTLHRLGQDIQATQANVIICLGDSFDDLLAASALEPSARAAIIELQQNKRWVWIEGNHDPGPAEFGGETHTALQIKGMTFRHIAEPGACAEISGHYHPKAHVRTRAKTVVRPAFLHDTTRVILPAYGTYTGGLASHHPVFADIFGSDARAIVTGKTAFSVPMPRSMVQS